MNDPFDGGMHLPDIFVFKPLFHEGERLGFTIRSVRADRQGETTP